MAPPVDAGPAALYLASKLAATPSEVVSAVNDVATTGVVTSAGLPNRLLYSGSVTAATSRRRRPA
jgi:hypothetical protein